MLLINSIYRIVLDALFPLSDAERTVLAYEPKAALRELPPAPSYAGLAIPADDARSMRSLFAYKDERVAKLVWHIKYKRTPRAVAIGGYALHQKLSKAGAAFQGALIVPMPITARRRRERGFNQCELLIEEMARLDAARATASRGGRFIFKKDLLIRTHHASRQTLKGRADRLESSKGIFSVNAIDTADAKTGTDAGIRSEDQRYHVWYRHLQALPVVIIDDVITTGSTMKEAMDTLKKAGFERVYGLSLAH